MLIVLISVSRDIILPTPHAQQHFFNLLDNITNCTIYLIKCPHCANITRARHVDNTRHALIHLLFVGTDSQAMIGVEVDAEKLINDDVYTAVLHHVRNSTFTDTQTHSRTHAHHK